MCNIYGSITCEEEKMLVWLKVSQLQTRTHQVWAISDRDGFHFQLHTDTVHEVVQPTAAKCREIVKIDQKHRTASQPPTVRFICRHKPSGWSCPERPERLSSAPPGLSSHGYRWGTAGARRPQTGTERHGGQWCCRNLEDPGNRRQACLVEDDVHLPLPEQPRMVSCHTHLFVGQYH